MPTGPPADGCPPAAAAAIAAAAAAEVGEKLCGAIDSGVYNMVVANFANPDMVEHNFPHQTPRTRYYCRLHFLSLSLTVALRVRLGTPAA